MAAINNTLTTYATIGIREELSDIISNISPMDTPFTAGAGLRPKAKSTFYEWQQDSLAAVDTTNARPEGNDHTTFTAVTPTVRVGNYCQISDKDIILSDTQEAVDKAGRKSDLAYNITKRGKELKRDIEATCLQRNTGASNSDPRKTAVLLSYVRTNVDMSTGGTAGVNPVAPAPTYAGNRTDGTQRAFTVAILKNIIQLGYTSGMKVDGSVLMVGPTQKGVVSGFTGIAQATNDVHGKVATTVGAVDVYVSDFGKINIVPNRFQRNRDAWLLDFDLIGFKDLRPYKTVDLAKSGDATKKLLLREWSLQVDNEAGLALAADLI